MTRHIVLIAPHAAMTDCARSHGLDITIIDKSENAKNYDGLPNINAFFYDYHDICLSKNLLRALHDSYPVAAIITLTEKALRVAAELSAFLHLAALPSSVINLIHDKNAMRAFLADKSDFSVKYSQPADSEELSLYADQNGFPFIVKPVDGYGSQGVTKITSYDQINKIDFSVKLVAEEFLNGDEYSVECFSFNGDHAVIAITRKILMDSPDGSNFTEMGHCVPAGLTEESKHCISDYIRKFLTLIGIDNGPSHTEIKVSGNSIRVIETHNRIGGDRISSLVKISTGVDLVELSILWPLGLCAPIRQEPAVKCHAAIHFFNPPRGRLISLTGTEMLKYSPSVIDAEISCKPGDEITPIKDSFNRYGFVITTGENESDAISNSVTASEKIVFRTTV